MWKLSKYGVISGSYFPVFGLYFSCFRIFQFVKSVNIQSYFWSVFSYIRIEHRDLLGKSEYRKIRTRNIPELGHFSRIASHVFFIISFSLNLLWDLSYKSGNFRQFRTVHLLQTVIACKQSQGLLYDTAGYVALRRLYIN